STVRKATSLPPSVAASTRMGVSGLSGYTPSHAKRSSAKTGGMRWGAVRLNFSIFRPAALNTFSQSGGGAGGPGISAGRPVRGEAGGRIEAEIGAGVQRLDLAQVAFGREAHGDHAGDVRRGVVERDHPIGLARADGLGAPAVPEADGRGAVAPETLPALGAL